MFSQYTVFLQALIFSVSQCLLFLYILLGNMCHVLMNVHIVHHLEDFKQHEALS